MDGKRYGEILINEVIFCSLAEHDAFIRELRSAPENAELVRKLSGLERRQSDVDLYRVVG